MPHQSENIARLFGALCHNEYYTRHLVAALIAGCSYEEVFAIVPTSGALWPIICRLHEMVVIWNPDQAHRWLEIASRLLCSPESDFLCAYVQGSMIGFLKAGIWLDERWQETVEYGDQLLPTLARIMCGPANLFLEDPRKLDVNFVRELTEAVKAYMCPKKANVRRARQVAEAVEYIRQYGRDENFSCVDQLIIERLCHGLLADRSATQKIAGIHYLFSNFGLISEKPASF